MLLQFLLGESGCLPAMVAALGNCVDSAAVARMVCLVIVALTPAPTAPDSDDGDATAAAATAAAAKEIDRHTALMAKSGVLRALQAAYERFPSQPQLQQFVPALLMCYSSPANVIPTA